MEPDDLESRDGSSFRDRSRRRAGGHRSVSVAQDGRANDAPGNAFPSVMSARDSIWRFAEHVAGTDYEDLPESAAVATRTFLLDTLGVGVAGSAGPWTRRLIETQRLSCPGDHARVWSHGARLSAAGAAVCNAYQIHNAADDTRRPAREIRPQLRGGGEADRPGGGGAGHRRRGVSRVALRRDRPRRRSRSRSHHPSATRLTGWPALDGRTLPSSRTTRHQSASEGIEVWRLRAQPCRKCPNQVVMPATVSRKSAVASVVPAATIALTRFPSPIAAYPDGIVSGKSRSGSVLRRAVGIDRPDLARVLLEHVGGARRDERVQVPCRVQRGDQDRLPDLPGPFPDGDRAPLPVSPRLMP